MWGGSAGRRGTFLGAPMGGVWKGGRGAVGTRGHPGGAARWGCAGGTRGQRQRRGGGTRGCPLEGTLGITAGTAVGTRGAPGGGAAGGTRGDIPKDEGTQRRDSGDGSGDVGTPTGRIREGGWGHQRGRGDTGGGVAMGTRGDAWEQLWAHEGHPGGAPQRGQQWGRGTHGGGTREGRWGHRRGWGWRGSGVAEVTLWGGSGGTEGSLTFSPRRHSVPLSVCPSRRVTRRGHRVGARGAAIVWGTKPGRIRALTAPKAATDRGDNGDNGDNGDSGDNGGGQEGVALRCPLYNTGTPLPWGGGVAHVGARGRVGGDIGDTDLHAHMCTLTRTRVHIRACTLPCARACARMRAHVCSYPRACVHALPYVHARTRVCTFTRKHTHHTHRMRVGRRRRRRSGGGMRLKAAAVEASEQGGLQGAPEGDMRGTQHPPTSL